MSQATLLGALPILAKMLDRRLGVDVVMGAAQAMTDGRTIYLPALPAEHKALAILAHGYIDHESAHIRFTDWTALKAVSAFEQHLVNILEDVRIERALSQCYPGSRHNLDRLITYLVEQGECQVPAPDAHPAHSLLSVLLFRLRARVLQQTALVPLLDPSEAPLRQRLPGTVLDQVLALADTVVQTASTAAVVDLARRIVALLQDAAVAGASATSIPGADPGPGIEPVTGTDDTLRATEVLHTLLEATPSACGQITDLGGQLATLLNAEAAHSSTSVSMAEFDPPAYPGHGQALVQQARASTVRLRRRLAGLVQAQRAESVWRSRRGRQLQGRALYRLSLPDPVLFQQCAEQPVLETAVYILLDRSTSMGRRMALAAQAALALALALETLPGVVVQVSAFPGSQDERLLPLVGFSEHSRRVAGRFQFAAQGNTPLPSALWRAGFELLQRPEPRRLLLTITDGEPQNVAATQDVIARCRASSIEVLGVGIKAQQTVQTLFGPTYAVALDESAELAPALFQMLQRQLCQYVA